MHAAPFLCYCRSGCLLVVLSFRYGCSHGPGLFFDHPKPAEQIQSPRGGSGSACKISFSSTLLLVQISVEAEGGEEGGDEHAPVVAHRTGHPEN